MYREVLQYDTIVQRAPDVHKIPTFPATEAIQSFDGRYWINAAFDQLALNWQRAQAAQHSARFRATPPSGSGQENG